MSSTQPFPKSRSHVLEVAESLIWNKISYEAVNTSQNLLTGTLTCVLTHPLAWILVHNQFNFCASYHFGRVDVSVLGVG